MRTSELLPTFDKHGATAGLVPRERVHALGLWHCAVHVWLYDRAGRVLVQRRSADKDIAAGLWDVACGEHVQPGESWQAAARRGVAEELGVERITLRPWGGSHAYVYEDAAAGIHDREIQRLYTATLTVEPSPEPAEVAALWWLTPAMLRTALATEPEVFAPGLRADIEEFGDRLLGPRA